MRSKILFNFLLCFAVHIAYGQTSTALLEEAKKLYPDNPKAGMEKAKMAYRYAANKGEKIQELKSLNMISTFYWDLRDYKLAREFVVQGLKLADDYGIDSLTGNLLNTSGLIDYSEGNYKSAIGKYQEAVGYFIKAKVERKIGITYLNLGISERKLSNFERANSNYFKAVEIFQKLNDTENVCGIYNSIGNCFTSLGDFKNAVRYHEMAWGLSKKVGDQQLIAQSLNNLGYSYLKYGKLDLAIKYLYKCLDIRKSEDDSGLLVLTLQNLGSALKEKGSLKLASEFILRSIAIAEKLQMKDELARGNLDLAELYQQEKEYDKAFIAVNHAARLAVELNSPELLEQSYGLHSKLSELDGKYNDALFYERKRNQLRDSLFSIDNSKAISEIELKYETKEKDKSIEALHAQSVLRNQVVNQQRYSILALVIAVVLMLLLLFLATKSYRQKTRDNLRIQNLMKELHHRVKNNLQILSGLFTLQLDEAADENVKISIRDNEMRLNSMNLIHQKLYFKESDTKIDIKEYLEQLMENIEISFNSKMKQITLVLEVEAATVEAEKVVPIGLIVNELATNAYKYAFKENGGEINIGFKRKSGNAFVLSVRDNGVGMVQPSADAKRSSFGLKLVEMMAQQLGSVLIVKTNPGVAYHLEIVI